MTGSHKPSKPSPKKYQPKGLTILHEDRDIIVVDKTAGLLTIGTEKVRENTAYYILNEYVRKGNYKSKNRIFIVHRLDRETSGVLVFARTEQAKQYLQTNWQGFQKYYHAVVHGALPEKDGQITSYLAENSALKMYSVTDPRKGQLATTGYHVLRESESYSLLRLDLLTGRKNQIRVHLADIGCPVVGDQKYGEKTKGIKRLALHASSITLTHPFSKESMTFKAEIPPYFSSLMKGSRKLPPAGPKS